MITAWVLYLDLQTDIYRFEEREGTAFDSVDSASWGLAPQHCIILVLQQASFIQAWIEGGQVKGR